MSSPPPGDASYHERLVYVCECPRGLAPHVHWDFWRGEPEVLSHPEPLGPVPTQEQLQELWESYQAWRRTRFGRKETRPK
jgi:hypothetical protein